MLERLLGYADDCYQLVGRHGWPSPAGCILESEKECVGPAVSNRHPICATIFLLFLQESAPIPSPVLTLGPTLTLTPSPTAEPRQQRGQGISLVHGVQTARVSVRMGLVQESVDKNLGSEFDIFGSSAGGERRLRLVAAASRWLEDSPLWREAGKDPNW